MLLKSIQKLPDFLTVSDLVKANKLSLNIVKNDYMIIATSQKLMKLGAIPKTKVSIVHSLSSGKVEMFLCAACHAFTPHVNAWEH